MRKILVLATSLGLLASSAAMAGRVARPIESLHDLPAKWTGVAGSVLSKVTATFTIDKVTKVDRQDPSSPGAFFSALYDVSATLNFGERSFNVQQVGLSRYSADSNIYDVTIYTGDELAPTLFGTVAYDEASDTYVLQEMPRSANERRFILRASAAK